MPAATDGASTTIADWTKVKPSLGPRSRDVRAAPSAGERPHATRAAGVGARRAPAPRAAPGTAAACRAAPQPRTTTPSEARPASGHCRRSGCACVAMLLVVVLAFAAIGVRLVDLQARDQPHLASLGLGQRVRTGRPPGRARQHLRPQRQRPRGLGAADDDRRRPARDQGPDRVRGEARADRAASTRPSSRTALSQPRRARSRTSPARSTTPTVDAGRRSSTSPASRTMPSRSASTRRARSPGPVLGFVGTDNNGLGGLEYALRGAPDAARRASVQRRARPAGQRDPGRRATGRRRPSAGKDLVLTIDQSLQCEDRAGAHRRASSTERQGRHGDRRRRADRRRARDGDASTAPPTTSPRRPRRATEQQQAGHRRLRAGLDQQGHHDGGRDRGRHRHARHRVRRRVRQTINVGDTDVRGRRAALVDDDASPRSCALVERRARSRSRDELGKERFDRLPARVRLRPADRRSASRRVAGHRASPLEPVQRHQHGVDADRLRHRGHARCRCSTCTRPSPTTGMARPPRLVAATVDADGERHDEPLADPHQVVSPGDRRRR